MPADSQKEIAFEIGHVLFIDIVGYSKGLIHEQSELLQKLKERFEHIVASLVPEE